MLKQNNNQILTKDEVTYYNGASIPFVFSSLVSIFQFIFANGDFPFALHFNPSSK